MLEQARFAGVAHVAYISIVGIDRIPYDYYHAKLAAQELVQNGGIPWSLLRATQFHYLVDLFFQAAAKLPLVTLLPTDLQCQSIAESAVASRLCEMVVAGPRGRLADLGGPEVLMAGEMVQSWLKFRGMYRRVLPFYVPGKVAQGFHCGYNTCPDQPVHGRITWTGWVQSKYEGSKMCYLSHRAVLFARISLQLLPDSKSDMIAYASRMPKVDTCTLSMCGSSLNWHHHFTLIWLLSYVHRFARFIPKYTIPLETIQAKRLSRRKVKRRFPAKGSR